MQPPKLGSKIFWLLYSLHSLYLSHEIIPSFVFTLHPEFNHDSLHDLSTYSRESSCQDYRSLTWTLASSPASLWSNAHSRLNKTFLSVIQSPLIVFHCHSNKLWKPKVLSHPPHIITLLVLSALLLPISLLTSTHLQACQSHSYLNIHIISASV